MVYEDPHTSPHVHMLSVVNCARELCKHFSRESKWSNLLEDRKTVSLLTILANLKEAPLCSYKHERMFFVPCTTHTHTHTHCLQDLAQIIKLFMIFHQMLYYALLLIFTHASPCTVHFKITLICIICVNIGIKSWIFWMPCIICPV